MVMDKPPQFLLLLAFLLSILLPTASSNVPALFIFGDSLFDAGTNPYNTNCTIQADFPPYGSSFFHRPTGRFTNGRTVADFISQFLDIPLVIPFLEAEHEIANGSRTNYPSNGLNFASAGSGVLPQTNNDLGVTPIQVQLQQLKTLVRQNHIPKSLITQSLFLLETGSNDIFNYLNQPTLPPDAYVQSMLAQVGTFLDTVYKLGARRIAIFGLGPVGCVPARVNFPDIPVSRCLGQMNNMVNDYNMGLENIVLRRLPVRYPGAVGVYGSVYTAVQDFRANPGAYGFRDVNNACCGFGRLGGEVQCGTKGFKVCNDPDAYLFWDFFHPTEHAYELISKALWSGGPTRIRPFNLKTLTNITLSHN